jgi:hypothetical protein
MKNVRWYAVPLTVAATGLCFLTGIGAERVEARRACESQAVPSFTQLFTGTLKDFKAS